MVYPKQIITSYSLPNKSLASFLQCDDGSNSIFWSCKARAELRLVSQKVGVPNITRKIKHVFCQKENDFGYRHFLSWDDILDPDESYIKDDTVILEVFVSADPPLGVNSKAKKRKRSLKDQ